MKTLLNLPSHCWMPIQTELCGVLTGPIPLRIAVTLPPMGRSCLSGSLTPGNYSTCWRIGCLTSLYEREFSFKTRRSFMISTENSTCHVAISGARPFFLYLVARTTRLIHSAVIPMGTSRKSLANPTETSATMAATISKLGHIHKYALLSFSESLNVPNPA